ncbi:MAG: transcription termination factor Rho, partial [Acidimicrobiales bacterium]
MAEEQLERSILQSKERDELQAIATAMSLDLAPRSKKNDIIDLILEATGVGDGAKKPAQNGSSSPRRKASNGARSNAKRAAALEAEEFPDLKEATTVVDLGEEFETDDSVEELNEIAEQNAERAEEGSTISIDTVTDESRHRTERRPQHQGQGHVDAANRRGRRRRGRDRGEIADKDAPWQGELVPVKGLLDLREEGYGFLRTGGYLPSPKDVYVSVSQARRFALRRGDAIEGACRPAGPSEKYPALVRIDSVSGLQPDEARQRPRFEDLTPLFPDSQLRLEMPGDTANLTARIVDLVSPIGRGQRGMIVSPPKAGKTTVMKQIAHSIEANNPDVHLIVLLVAERPEEVTDMRRTVKGEVIASTFDRPADEHTAVSELTIERAKRLVEMGRDVVILLDGITRLARAYNLAQPATGRIMSGGVDSGALYPPKKFFGAARNVEE